MFRKPYDTVSLTTGGPKYNDDSLSVRSLDSNSKVRFKNKADFVSNRDRMFLFNSSQPEAVFKELGPRLKFKSWLKYGWFHLKLYSMFQDLNWRLIETGL